jgi:hypothetical protein
MRQRSAGVIEVRSMYEWVASTIVSSFLLVSVECVESRES